MYHIRVRACTNKYLYTHIHVCTCIHTNIHICKREPQTHIHVRTHTHIHLCIYTHTHTHTQVHTCTHGECTGRTRAKVQTWSHGTTRVLRSITHTGTYSHPRRYVLAYTHVRTHAYVPASTNQPRMYRDAKHTSTTRHTHRACARARQTSTHSWSQKKTLSVTHTHAHTHTHTLSLIGHSRRNTHTPAVHSQQLQEIHVHQNTKKRHLLPIPRNRKE
jgi:hypothetical protein